MNTEPKALGAVALEADVATQARFNAVVRRETGGRRSCARPCRGCVRPVRRSACDARRFGAGRRARRGHPPCSRERP